MNPVYSQFGKLLGWLSGNVIFGADGKNIAFVRNGEIYSPKREYWGQLVYRRDQLVWYR